MPYTAQQFYDAAAERYYVLLQRYTHSWSDGAGNSVTLESLEAARKEMERWAIVPGVTGITSIANGPATNLARFVREA